jgi:hypothetical protein
MAMRLFIYRNEAGAEGKVLSIKSSDSLSYLKHAASKKLRIRAKRRYGQVLNKQLIADS